MPRSRPIVSRAIAERRLLSFEYYKENEDEFTTRRVEPYALINGREGWYLASFDPARDRRPALPPRPVQVGRRDRRDLRAAAGRRPRRRRRRLAADRRGPGFAPRPRVDLTRARALGARGARRDRRARGRLGDRRARLRGHASSSSASAQGGRRRGRARARGRPRRRCARPPRRSPRAASSSRTEGRPRIR